MVLFWQCICHGQIKKGYELHEEKGLWSFGSAFQYPNISGHPHFFQSNGIQLSHLGNKIFLNSIQGELEKIYAARSQSTHSHIFSNLPLVENGSRYLALRLPPSVILEAQAPTLWVNQSRLGSCGLSSGFSRHFMIFETLILTFELPGQVTLIWDLMCLISSVDLWPWVLHLPGSRSHLMSFDL